MNPASFVLGSTVKLSDVIREEMASFSKDRETRRTAVQKILTERGLGHVLQSMGDKGNEDLSKRKNEILYKLAGRRKLTKPTVEGDIISYINYYKTHKRSPLVESTTSTGTEATSKEVCHERRDKADLRDLNRDLEREGITSSTAPTSSKAAQWKFGQVPVIVVTPTSLPSGDNSTLREPSESDQASLTAADDASLGSSFAALLPSADCPTDVAEIGLAYSTYQKMVSEAPSAMKNSLTSNKWEVISYLSGVPMQNFRTRVPEWYIALQDVLASFNMSERAKKEQSDKQFSESPT